MDDFLLQEIRNSLINTYFSKQSDWSGSSKLTIGKEKEIQRHVEDRYLEFSRFFLPWIERNVQDLDGSNVLEIGCGTGSSGAAMAPSVASLVGYDINKNACIAAKERWDILDVKNTEARYAHQNEILKKIDEDIADASVDIVLLFAVLEHQTIDERLETLTMCWRKLTDNGYLVIGETPNRLTYFDVHTSKMSFFHMLPLDLQKYYYMNSSREEYVANLNEKCESSDQEGFFLSLTRWGQSVSYHEFEVAIGKQVHGQIIANGHDREILNLRPYRLEEKLLVEYLARTNFKINTGFSRYYLDFIIKKTNDYSWNCAFDKIEGLS